MSENFARQMSRVEFRVTSGRIVARSSTFGGRLSSSTNVDGEQERLTIDFAGGLPTIEYARSTADEQLTIRVAPTTSAADSGDPEAADFFPPVLGADRIQIHLVPKSETSSITWVEFQQEPNFDLLLEVGNGDERRRVRAATLWYLLMAEPVLCRDHLIPLLAMLRQDWRLSDTAGEIERGMVRAIQQQQLPDRHRWAALVEALGSDDYGIRREADRELRRAGRPIVPFLESLPRRTLDAEQRFRIRRIVMAIGFGESEDTAERMSVLAAGDPRAWLALLSHEELARREMAVVQLKELLHEPIDFDPAADAFVRREQIGLLRERFDGGQAEEH